MPWGNMRGFELLIIALLIVLLFGAKRLPDLTRSVARSLKIFRTEVKNPAQPDGTGDTGATPSSDPGAATRPGAPTAPYDGDQKRT